ncbi:hypothetical protein H6F67_20025 [Microcoleus sp. FACHB-1515]|uniref:hypothetical protein n=1 Tax=Cyanophyceae TaxID=3028117 RepID=UPI0016842E23|nr:hypothetical protein [Microcoleus sp. FACHB-1515]MBD2092141.1 hypothetical protein [Microcoleus sp. FACHB-1515]
MPASESPFDPQEFERSLQELEQSVVELRSRFEQVKTDQQRQQELRQRSIELQRRRQSPQTQAELKRVREQLDALELALESHLFSWSGLKEAFWQAVRFLGLGIVIGWLLRAIVHG